MTMLPDCETADNQTADVENKITGSRKRLLWGRFVLWFFAAFLLATAMVGLMLMIDLYAGNKSESAPKIFYAISMTCLPLFLLGIFVSYGTRYFDRLRLAISYNERMDKLQRRLNYREDLLRLVADHRQGAITIYDQHNRYWYLNRVSAEHIGKPVLELIGKPVFRILDADKAKRLELLLAEARSTANPIERIDRMVDEKGETRFIQSRFESLTPFAELMGGVLVSEEDLTSLIIERERRERMLRQVIETLVAVVDRRDPYAAGHSGRVGQLARAIAAEMGLDQKLMETCETAGSLMNFGKVLVSRSILTKTTPLTTDELQRVRDSILVSADILSIIGFDGPVVPTLRQVLEHFDGTGVPEGLKGDAILITARIVAVANSFVAIVSPRAHREGLTFRDTLHGMMREADKLYDRRVLIALSNYIENRPDKLDWLKATPQT